VALSVAANSALTGGGTVDPATALGGAPGVGDVVVVVVVSVSGGAETAFGGTLVTSGDWTQAFAVNSTGPAASRMEVWLRTWTGTEPASWTVTHSGTTLFHRIAQIDESGGQTIVLDKAVSYSGDGGAGTNHPLTSTGTLADAVELVLPAWGLSTTPTTPSFSDSLTIVGAASSLTMASKVTAAATALTPTLTSANNIIGLVGGTVTFRAVAPGTVVTPGEVATVLGVPSPTIVADGLVAPGSVALALGVPAPTVAGDTVLGASPVPMALGVPTPTVVVGTAVAAPSVPLALGVPTPSIAFDTTVTPLPVALGLGVPSPVPRGDTVLPLTSAVALRLGVSGGGLGFVSPAVSTAKIEAAPSSTYEVTGDVDIVLECDLYPDGVDSYKVLASRWLSGNIAWGVRMTNASRIPRFTWSSGVGSTSVSASASIPVSSGPVALRITLDLDTGAGQYLLRFYYATDLNHTTGGATWTQVGADRTGPTMALNAATGVPLRLWGGWLTPASDVPIGRLFYFHLANGIGGPVVARWDAVRAGDAEQVRNGSGELGDTTAWDPASFTWTAEGLRNSQFSGNPTMLDYIPVDPTKGARYQMAWRGDPGVGQRHYVAFDCFDAGGLQIDVAYGSNVIALGVLAADLKPGDTTITLVSSAGWNNASIGHTRSLGLWPFTDAAGKVWTREERYTRHVAIDSTNGVWPAGGIVGNVITLSTPWVGPTNPAHPNGWWLAGTEVANVQSGSTYQYALAVNEQLVDDAWVRKAPVQILPAPTMSSLPPNSSTPANAYRPGTRSIRLRWLTNRNVMGGATIYREASWKLDDPTGSYVDPTNQLRWTATHAGGSAFEGIPAPTITATGSVSPSPVALALGVPAPTPAGDTRLALAGAVELTLGVPSPTKVVTAPLQPVALTLGVPSPTVMGGTGVPIGAPVALTLGIPTPTIDILNEPTHVVTAEGLLPGTAATDRFPLPPWDPTRTITGSTVTPYRPGAVEYDD
jgi:hypothetical protein